MSENYLFIEGIKVPLTDEQIAMIKGTGALKSKEKSPFSRVEKNNPYWLIDIDGTITKTYDFKGEADDNQFSCANYCSDKELIEERAIREELSRLLWRFSMENGSKDIDWEDPNRFKYSICIYFDGESLKWEIGKSIKCKCLNEVFFIDEDTARRAIREIVEPFCADDRIREVIMRSKG